MTIKSQYLLTIKNNWELLAKEDPLWAILSDPKMKGNKWRSDLFFNTGDQEIHEIKSKLSKLNINLGGNVALDFGCGVGRLTRALSKYFSLVYGLDISQQMITLAKKYNKKYNNCNFLVNSENKLNGLADSSLDFVYTNLTLQHIEPKYSKKYLIEFLRILKKNGVLIFQLPGEYHQPNKNSHWFDKFIKASPKKLEQYIPMYGIEKKIIQKLIIKLGAKIIAVYPNALAGPGWESFWYFVKKVV